MKEILFFSNNKNKIKEILLLFNKTPLKILSLNDFKKIKSPKEIGKTFEKNAKIKSLFGLEKFNKICFADDSGICISAMGGLPGINSKKLLSSEKNKLNIFNQIINFTKDKKNFAAFFQTSICLSLDKNRHFFFKGIIKGNISRSIRGQEGFGYDPIFIPENQKKTFGEMNQIEKNLISHRSIAINELKQYILSI